MVTLHLRKVTPKLREVTLKVLKVTPKQHKVTPKQRKVTLKQPRVTLQLKKVTPKLHILTFKLQNLTPNTIVQQYYYYFTVKIALKGLKKPKKNIIFCLKQVIMRVLIVLTPQRQNSTCLPLFSTRMIVLLYSIQRCKQKKIDTIFSHLLDATVSFYGPQC